MKYKIIRTSELDRLKQQNTNLLEFVKSKTLQHMSLKELNRLKMIISARIIDIAIKNES